ncbi:hypothetical protein QFZ39_005263 [Paraburkholderia graminis]|nr:hypothetical protein [Paraburkholderia graminis]
MSTWSAPCSGTPADGRLLLTVAKDEEFRITARSESLVHEYLVSIVQRGNMIGEYLRGQALAGPV